MAGRKWEQHEIKYLIYNYGKIPTEEIARRLGRTPAAVDGKAYRLGLSGNYKGYYPPNLKKILKASGSNTLEEIDKIDRKIRNLIHALGVKFDELAKEVSIKIKPIEKDLGVRVLSVEVYNDLEDPTYKYVLVTITSDRLIELSREPVVDGHKKWYEEYKRTVNAAHDWVEENMPGYGRYISFECREKV